MIFLVKVRRWGCRAHSRSAVAAPYSDALHNAFAGRDRPTKGGRQRLLIANDRSLTFFNDRASVGTWGMRACGRKRREPLEETDDASEEGAEEKLPEGV